MRSTRWQRLLTEPPRPRGIAGRPNAYWYAVGTVCIGAFMGQLDASIVTVAFPHIGRTFDAGLGAVAWVGLAYLLVLVALVTAFGRIADMVGHKLLYTYGFVVFIVGSALCGLAPTLLSLDAFRLVQAVGAAMLQANSVAIILLAMPREKLGRAIGVQGAAQALGLALGPSVGGGLIALGGWRLIFYVNVPVGLAATVLAWFLIPRSRDLQHRARFDWPGLALFVPAVAAVLYAISLGDQDGWLSPDIVVALAGGVVLAVLFVIRERSTKAPVIGLGLFRRVRFSAGISSGLLSYLVMFGTLFIVPFYLEDGPQHLSSGMTGLELTVMPAALGVVAPLAGRAADRVGPRTLTVAGMAVTAAALLALAATRPAGPLILPLLAVVGAGLGLFTPPNNAAIMGSAPREQAGLASGILNTTRGLGTAMGLATTSLVLGLVAGTSARVPALVVDGFTASALYLAIVALGAMGLAGLPGGWQIHGGGPD
ncbi:MAG TPA: DHA2 family efflux MFS transporter permease subunit [Candidatus Binatia bacterium]|nr:DHA2 family efflux MFS transporter permease subunit [Candidatus Binatia bacterium]